MAVEDRKRYLASKEANKKVKQTMLKYSGRYLHFVQIFMTSRL